MKVIMSVLFLIFIFLVSSFVAAQQSAGAWDTYKGVSQWRVDVTEDETGCGGSVITDSRSVQIQHNLKTAEVSDWAHGNMRGTVAGNTISIPSKTIPDGEGTSKLSAFDILFTPDCSGFTAKYRWDYRDAQQSCSGSTELRGTRTDGKGCPQSEQSTDAEDMRKELEEAHAEVDVDKKEKMYNVILAKDPKNFWANWDMAELKKSHGEYKEFMSYVDKAADTIADKHISEKLKNRAIEEMHLSEPPTTVNSLLLKSIVDNELKNWEGGRIYNVDFKKEDAKKEVSNWEKFKIKIRKLLDPKTNDIVNELVGIPNKDE